MKKDPTQYIELDSDQFVEELIDNDGMAYSEVDAPVDSWMCADCGTLVGFLLNDDVERWNDSMIVWVPAFQHKTTKNYYCEECINV